MAVFLSNELSLSNNVRIFHVLKLINKFLALLFIFLFRLLNWIASQLQRDDKHGMDKHLLRGKQCYI